MSSAQTASMIATPTTLSARARFWLAVAIGFVVSLALCWGRVVDIWTTGNFYDSDDAMRIVQVRDFMAGQGWHDLTAWRIDPPTGSLMHWSRVVDAPLALLMKLFQAFAPGETGERLARVVFPLSLQLALLCAVGWTARVVLGARAIGPAIALAVLSGFMFGQFVPGRVDHHAPQIVLLILMAGSMAAALDPARAPMAAVATVCAAFSLAISIENLPFLFVLFATPTMLWIARGARARPLLGWFAGGQALAVPLVFGLFNPPSRWLTPACDAFSTVHVALGLGAAAGTAIIAWASRWPLGWGARLASAAGVGALIGAPLLVAFSGCLIDPFQGLDPLVRDIWLDNVGEARPILKHFALYPRSIQIIAIPTLIGLAGLAMAWKRERGVDRDRIALMLALSCMGCASAFFMIRMSTSLAPLVLFGGAWIAARLSTGIESRGLGRAGAAALALLACIPMSAIGWAMAPSLVREPPRVEENPAACLAAASFKPLARLTPGLALAPIEVGAYLLAHTPHSVITAAYHRNNAGNRLAIDAFMAPPDKARDMIRARGAKYVFFCAGDKELTTTAARAPDGLSAALAAGAIPDWLRPIDMPGTPYRVFAVE